MYKKSFSRRSQRNRAKLGRQTAKIWNWLYASEVAEKPRKKRSPVSYRRRLIRSAVARQQVEQTRASTEISTDVFCFTRKPNSFSGSRMVGHTCSIRGDGVTEADRAAFYFVNTEIVGYTSLGPGVPLAFLLRHPGGRGGPIYGPATSVFIGSCSWLHDIVTNVLRRTSIAEECGKPISNN
ncbi:10204_t:CDS:2, partial [Cetraspora pellucida]